MVFPFLRLIYPSEKASGNFTISVLAKDCQGLKGNCANMVEEKNTEIAALEKHIETLQKRLWQAETALRYYADRKNYVAASVDKGVTFYDRLIGDTEHVRNGHISFVVGGARARNHLKRFCNE